MVSKYVSWKLLIGGRGAVVQEFVYKRGLKSARCEGVRGLFTKGGLQSRL